MRLTTAAICEQARERADGRLDLIGILRELSAPGFPAVQEHMTAVFVLEWSREEAGAQPLRADLLGPGGRRVLSIEGETEVTPGVRDVAPQTRLILPLEQVVFPEPGEYEFELIAGGDAIRVCPLRIRHLASP